MLQRHPILDDERKWDDSTPPPAFDSAAFQRRIDERVGLNRDGKSILRLVFAPSVWHRTMGEAVKRYWVRRTPQADGSYAYVCPPRWVIEKRLERESYWDAHQATRWQTDPRTGELTDLGPPPEDFYVFDSLIADHDSLCCARAWEGEEKFDLNSRGHIVKKRVGGRRRCWGYYREPASVDLAEIERAVQKMNADPYWNPYLPLSPEQLAAIELNASLDAGRLADEANKRQRESADDFAKSYNWRLLETDAGRLSHGRYFFTNSNFDRRDSGLFVPA